MVGYSHFPFKMRYSSLFLSILPLLSLLISIPAGNSDLAADRLAILALRKAVGGRSLLWNISQPSTPCTWPGVYCTSNRVTELHLPGMGLSGQIPPNTITNLTELNTLSLRFNSLTGPFPVDIFALHNLRNLYLQDNFFSGPIPDELYSLNNLVRVNLAHNNFSGPISVNLNNLSRLATLYLEDNGFTGVIPDLNLPGLVQFNVSNNKLSGPIPSKLSGMPASAFAGNSLCGGPLLSCDGSQTGGGGGGRKKLSSGAIGGIIIGAVIGFLLICLILFLLCRRRGKKGSLKSREAGELKSVEVENPREKEKMADESDASSGAYPSLAATAGTGSGGKGKGEIKKLIFFGKSGGFDLEDLLRASAEVLGKGTFGTAYKAVLEVGLTVAVKRLKDVVMPEKEFRSKIEAVGKMDHENLVRLRAYYCNGDEKLLVYDYMPLGSLSALLHGNRGAGRTPLNWETRSAIALGAARGITYLHSQGSTVSHGNIKSSNILLTTSYDSRVSDFGLAQLVGPTSTPNRIDGYRAPEVTDPRKISQKADVYSFGVLLLELLTGKPPTHALLNEEGVDLPRWVQSVVREEWTAEVFDVELLRYQNVEEDMVQLLQLAIDCTQQYPDKRPCMVDVTSHIEELCRSASTTSTSYQSPHNDIVHSADEQPGGTE